jgi:L-fuculose-phosphate aldolase
MTRLEREIIRWGKLLFERRLISGWGGNLSCRNGKNQFLITGQHAPLGFLRSKDLVPIGWQGKPIKKNQRPSSETPMHLAIYRGTDARTIVHAHPPMVLAFSLTHDNFVPVSFEEKYTIGEVPIISYETPTVTKPEKLVEELKYHPIVILKSHGTVAIGKDFQEAYLLTDLLEEAVHCQFVTRRLANGNKSAPAAGEPKRDGKAASTANGGRYALFSREHMDALVKSANEDSLFRRFGSEASLTTSLTLHMEENDTSWTVNFVFGEIAGLQQTTGGEFLISGKREWWAAVFNNRMDPFHATQQGKLKLQRGELARLAQWYKPFQRAFSLWQSIPVG